MNAIVVIPSIARGVRHRIAEAHLGSRTRISLLGMSSDGEHNLARLAERAFERRGAHGGRSVIARSGWT
jgi:hypothetical protein